MSKVKCPRHGFTALEILIVIAILAILLATILPSFMNFRRNSLLNTDTMNLVTLINRARLLSVSSKDDERYGIHLETTKAVLFKGGVYDTASSTNETHIFSTGLSLSSIAINGGGSEVLFEKVTGATTQNATTTLLVTGTTSSTTVLILPTGIATIN
ncbi:MAG: prepilin-type N-terminal cleavage/methylation domain-containing protein [Minisyncoccia bacterium]